VDVVSLSPIRPSYHLLLSTTTTHTNPLQAQKDLPVQLLTSSQPLRATLLLASFGTSQPFSNHVFNLDVHTDPNAARPKYEKPLRYGKLPEIHHIFKSDPKSGPMIISLFFVIAVLATVPVLLGTVSLPSPSSLEDWLDVRDALSTDYVFAVGISRRES
jgi:hypothetical protein